LYEEARVQLHPVIATGASRRIWQRAEVEKTEVTNATCQRHSALSTPARNNERGPLGKPALRAFETMRNAFSSKTNNSNASLGSFRASLSDVRGWHRLCVGRPIRNSIDERFMPCSSA
jgi:hypothetical protein